MCHIFMVYENGKWKMENVAYVHFFTGNLWTEKDWNYNQQTNKTENRQEKKKTIIK